MGAPSVGSLDSTYTPVSFDSAFSFAIRWPQASSARLTKLKPPTSAFTLSIGYESNVYQHSFTTPAPTMTVSKRVGGPEPAQALTPDCPSVLQDHECSGHLLDIKAVAAATRNAHDEEYRPVDNNLHHQLPISNNCYYHRDNLHMRRSRRSRTTRK